MVVGVGDENIVLYVFDVFGEVDELMVFTTQPIFACRPACIDTEACQARLRVAR